MSIIGDARRAKMADAYNGSKEVIDASAAQIKDRMAQRVTFLNEHISEMQASLSANEGIFTQQDIDEMTALRSTYLQQKVQEVFDYVSSL